MKDRERESDADGETLAADDATEDRTDAHARDTKDRGEGVQVNQAEAKAEAAGPPDDAAGETSNEAAADGSTEVTNDAASEQSDDLSAEDEAPTAEAAQAADDGAPADDQAGAAASDAQAADDGDERAEAAADGADSSTSPDAAQRAASDPVDATDGRAAAPDAPAEGDETEASDVPATDGAEGAAGQAAVAAADPSSQLPSIVVDPSIQQRGDELSEEEADRFAASYRPSWGAVAPVSETPSMPPAAVVRGPADNTGTHTLPTVAKLESQRRRAMWLTGAGVGGFVLLAAVGIWTTSEGEPKTGTTPAPAAVQGGAPDRPAEGPSGSEPEAEAHESDEAAATRPPTAGEEEAEAVAEQEATEHDTPVAIQIRITTDPRDAALSLDGQPVDNPFAGLLAPGSEHLLEAASAGHEPLSERIVVEQERTFHLALPALAPTPPAVAAPAEQAATTPDATAAAAAKARKRRALRAARRRRAREARRQRAAERTSKPATKKKGAGFVSSSPY